MYGKLPREVAVIENTGKEMMFYQDLPIKLSNQISLKIEDRLSKNFGQIVSVAVCDFIGEFGLDRYVSSYIYVCAKRLYQNKGCSFNRKGWHTDGFMTNDITYLWSDSSPTVFSHMDYNLTQDHNLSMIEMKEQHDSRNDVVYLSSSLLQLDQYVVHKVGKQQSGIRSFCKVVFSKDKFDREGNACNYLLEYNWEMKPRSLTRNVPQSIIS
jgi:hypothetical protein